jgi:hypothetical protein
MTDFSAVANFGICIGDHPDFPDASSTQLNHLYATLLNNPTVFFVDPTSCTNIRPNQDIMAHLCDVLVNEVIVPVAMGTTINTNCICIAFNSSPLCLPDQLFVPCQPPS